ncbi:MAG: Fe-S cluster assembly ATPase SufC [Candidatus Aenigmatarchaeota archaeon]
MSLEIKNLYVNVKEKQVLKNLNLTINPGEIHVIMGPNGSGKTSLCLAIMGHPEYKIMNGEILLDGEDIKNLPVNEKTKKGLFVAFQNPVVIPGLNIENFLRYSYNAVKNRKTENKGEELISVLKFKKILNEKMKLFRIKKDIVKRNLNEGFSGGEKKKIEMLQLALLEPKYAFLDEIDSGLDLDSLKNIADYIKKIVKESGLVIITHYQRFPKYIEPNYVHIIKDGEIVETGDCSLIEEIEKKGYEKFNI